jgi:hypothetical protein
MRQQLVQRGEPQQHFDILALAARLPTMHGLRGYVATEGFVSYGPDFSGLFRRSGDYINKILKGAKPADLPVEEPTKIELVVNLKTAKALGLAISQTFLMRAACGHRMIGADVCFWQILLQKSAVSAGWGFGREV